MSNPVPVDRRKWKKVELDLDSYVRSLDKRLKDLAGTVIDLKRRLETLEGKVDTNQSTLSERADHVAWELLAVKRVVIEDPATPAIFFDPKDPIPSGEDILRKLGYYDHR